MLLTLSAYIFQISAASSAIEKIRQEATDCKDQPECLAKITAEIDQDMEILPKMINDELKTKDFMALKTNITNCVETNVNEHKAKGTIICDRIVSCIKSKM